LRVQRVEIDYSRKWYVMAAVAMGIFLGSIDGSIVNLALPTLVREYGADFATVQWVVLAYLLALTMLMVSMGRLGDMVGKKPVYNTGFVIFTAGSLLCGLAPTVYWLIGFRVLQAIGASMTAALGTAILAEAFPPGERGKALGIGGSLVSIGIVAGPTLGGLIIDALSWHWIFFVNLPVGILGTLMVMHFVPDIKPAGRQRFDALGALTLFVSLLSLLLALTTGQQLGFGDLRILLLFANWALFTGAFILVEWRCDQPMVDLRLFRSRLFSVNLTTGLITFVAMAGTTILMPFYLENVLGYEAHQVGLLLAAVPIGMGVIAPISGSLSDRFGTRPITVLGLATLLVGYYAVSTLSTQTSAVGYMLRFLPLGVGMGIFQSPNNSAVMGTAPRERLGVASGLLSITRTLGQIAGIAVLGAVWASRVFHHAGVTLPGGATTAEASAQVAGLQDTFLGTVFIIAVALALGIWALAQERGRQSTPADKHPQTLGL
jgi:EmrB/QacA subfamily drug resistance transporter